MKKLFILVAVCAITISHNLFAQNNTTSKSPSILSSYYGIKNALVAGNSEDAAKHALQMAEVVNTIDSQKVKADVRDEILVDATHISKSKDINHQREHFARLSSNMYAVAKSVKLSEDPIYYDYCPMKKSFWLSSFSAIKNPYYGNQMLTCGKVTETLKKSF